METKIKWNEGDGYITATYEGSGNGSASIASDINEGIDRTQSITVRTTQGSEPKSEPVQVTQIGLREVFESSDGGFVLNDGGTLNVLKVGGVTPSVPMGVSIATSEGLFVPYADWSNQGTAVGVCVKTDSFTIILDLEIASKRWTQSTSSSVSGVPTFTSTNNISQYMDGQSYTDSMIARTSSTTYAAGYARSRKITINGTEYVGYVGSAGEWQAVMSYDDDIMAAFTKLGKSFSGSTSSRNIWTSCQYSKSNAWRFSFTSSGFGGFGNTSKTSSAYVKALFKYE